VQTTVPQSIIIATISNFFMLFAYVICLLFTIGDVERVSNTPTGLPLIEVYYQATKSKSATNVLTLMPALVLLFTLFNDFASVSRLTCVFARDKGLPFSDTFSYVSLFPLGEYCKIC
jgi:amino acid transporter